MQAVLIAAKAQGKRIGTDGVAIPDDVVEVMPPQCICDGSGYAPVMLHGMVVATPPCPKCNEDSDG